MYHLSHVSPFFLKKTCPFCAKNRWTFRLLVFWLEIQGTTLFRLTPPGGSDWLDWLPETPDLSPDLKNSRRFAGCFRWRTAALHRCKARVTKLHKKIWTLWCFSDSKVFFFKVRIKWCAGKVQVGHVFFKTVWIILNRSYPTYSRLGDPTTWNTWWMTTVWNHHLTWWTNNMIESLQRWSTTKINPGFFWNSFRSSRPCGKALRSRKRDFSMRSSYI